jgi:uncharacterized protein with FMN-binding domain
MKSSYNTYTPRIVGALAIAIVAGAGGYLLFTSTKSMSASSATTTTSQVASTTSSATPATSASATTTDTSTTSSSTVSSGYKDGTYSSTITYSVPKGATNTLAVTLSISGGKITVVDTANTIEDRESQEYVDSFSSRISSSVVGTTISDAYVGRVGGASLTSNAFNNALDAIMTNAAA